MSRPLRILHVEDNPLDAALVRSLLEREGHLLEVVRTDNRDAYLAALEAVAFDLIFCDYTLPSFDGHSALVLAQERRPDTPFIFVSGTIGEEVAIEALQAGATDYVLKTRLSRLVPVVRRILKDTGAHARHRETEDRLRLLEQRFESIFESSVDAIAYLARDGTFCLVNRALCELTGYPRDELLGRPYTLLTPEEHLERTIALGRRVRETGEPTEYEKDLLRKDGTRVPVALTVFRVTGPDGTVQGLAAIIKDLTERKKLEAQYYQAQKMEAIGQLAGGVAHDFNNLLTIINGYTQLLLADLDPSAPQREPLAQVAKAGERAAVLTSQLLAFSRKQPVAPTVLDLNAVVADSGKLLARLVGSHIAIETDLAADLYPIKADRGQIDQILMNLAVNARDAMPEGGRLRIATANRVLDEAEAGLMPGARPGAYAMLTVADTGCGMDEATRARIFEPFFTTKEAGKGTGLGLATVYGIVKQSGGYIAVDSRPGAGTTFRLYLPRTDEAAQPARSARPSRELPGGTETVLLVEDEPAIRALTGEVLRARGYRVLEAGDGAEALDLAAAHAGPIHLLLTDVVVPRLDGAQLAARLAALRPETKVLFTTGYSDSPLILRRAPGGGWALLQKPFTPTQLLRRVREVLDCPTAELPRRDLPTQ